jgi:hypothetical protein
MSIVGEQPWEPVEPTARMLCMVMRIAQMDQADGCATLALAYAIWLEGDARVTPEQARLLFEASGASIPAAVDMLRRSRDAENR